MTILVTGASGFLGKKLIIELSKSKKKLLFFKATSKSVFAITISLPMAMPRKIAFYARNLYPILVQIINV